MKLSPREQWLVACLLPVVLLVVMEITVLRPLRARVAEKRASIESKGRLEDLESRARDLNSRVEGLRSELASAVARGGVAMALADQVVATKEVSRLCADAGLSLIASASPVRATGVPAPLMESIQRCVSGPRAAPDLWQFDFEASYPEMLALLESLASCDTFILPLHLDMEADPGQGGVAVWSLVLLL